MSSDRTKPSILKGHLSMNFATPGFSGVGIGVSVRTVVDHPALTTPVPRNNLSYRPFYLLMTRVGPLEQQGRTNEADGSLA